MAAPVLNMYEYQYGDSGVLLNGSPSLPFIDILKVSGLDLPPIEAGEIDYDSQNGGFIYARFVTARTIIFDGVLYANPSTIDQTLQTLRNNFSPSETDTPLYVRDAGLTQQYIMCKPIGLKYDVDRLRGYGACNIQIQLKAGDPTRYIDKANLAMTAGTNYSITNNGNTITWPRLITAGPFTELAVVNNNTGETVGLVFTADADDDIILDFKTRSLLINDVNASGLLTSIGWWPFRPGVAESFKLFSVGTNIMVNPDTESNYTAGYSVGTNWTGTQGATNEKHKGTRSLKMVRKNKTNGNGFVVIPTGITGQAAGTYTAWVWLKGSMPNVSVRVRNGGTQVGLVSLAKVNSKSWTKIQLTYTLAATSGAIDFMIYDDGAPSLKKGQTLYIDDMGISAINATSFNATMQAKDGWL